MESESMEIIEIKYITNIPKNFTGIIKCSNGSQYWYRNGKWHWEDGPAVIEFNGTQAWYRNGKLNRKDGPAIIYPNGAKSWYLNGKVHREDGPAVIYHDGTQYWYFNGEEITPMELFERLSDEQKEKILWNLNQWK